MQLLKLMSAALLLPPAILSSQVPMMKPPKESEIEHEISQSAFLSLHRTLCQQNSVTNKENLVGLVLKKYLEKHHFKVTTQTVPPRSGSEPGRGPRLNLYAVPDLNYYKSHGSNSYNVEGKNKPKVLLTSHIDTVPPHIDYNLKYIGSTSEPFNRSSILIRGRGTVDDKACVAAQVVTALEFLNSSDKINPADIALLFVVDEESGGQGMVKFSDSTLYASIKNDLKAILFGEPTERKLVSAHKGIFMLRVDAHGKAAHSGYPWLGRSATSMILPALTALDHLQSIPSDQGGLPDSDELGNTTINVGLMQGGVAANVVPEHASAEISFRLAAGTVEENQEIIKKVIESADPHGLLEYSFTQGYGPVHLDADVPGFESFTVNYGTDVPNLDVPQGVKRYLYGPGSIFVAHGADEGLTVGELEAGLEGYRRLLEFALQL